MATNKELRKVQKWYHATTNINAEKILSDGFIKPTKGRYVFLADSIDNALQFMSMRGINENIVVFKIKKHQLDTRYYKDNTCDAVLKSMQGNKELTIAYSQPIDITRCKYTECHIATPIEAPEGCSFTNENGKIGITVDNIQEFEQMMKDGFDDFRDQIARDTGLHFQDFEAYKLFAQSMGGDNFADATQKGFDHFTKDLT
jgi:hypothetical protein